MSTKYNFRQRPTAAFAKVDIPSDLLHRRLGHHSIQALGLASKSNLWADASLIPSEDTFCWGCETTFSKKANRGKSDLFMTLISALALV